MKITQYLLPSLALGAAALLFAPTEAVLGYSTIGGSLSAEAQRDVRVYNNFADAASNNNVTIDPNWPGWDGAELSLWKATAEWGSEVFGDGTGDPLQTVGSGGANFDAYWAGDTTAGGGVNSNIISAITSCSSGVIAYVMSPISDGWTMKFCDGNFQFADGPGSALGAQFDIQGIATHEYGHSLGLGHTSVTSATMYYATSYSGSNNQRSIESDDINGVRYIYGTKSATKPKITAISIVGTTLTITGSNFSTTGNEVWLTNDLATATTANPHLKVTGVSSTGGGTQIVVTMPGGAGPGNVMVKKALTGHSSLSNAWPLDIAGTPPPDPVAAFTASPTTGPAPLFVAFTNQSTGTGIYAYDWDLGDGGTSTATSPGYFYMTGGTFTVSLTVTGSNGQDTETKVNYIVVDDGGPFASATTRNGSGVNPDIFTSTSLPVLGTDWNSEVDAGSIGVGGFVFVFVYAGSLPGAPTAFGELLLDPAAAWLYTDMAIAFSGIASHSIGIPSDPIYAGNQAFAQGYLNSVAPSGQLTNAIDLVLGY
jgi:PKD repeat protein